jgi:hypothetical protein
MKQVILLIISTAVVLWLSIFIITGIQYHPDPAGWDCNGGNPFAGVCAPVDNRAQQFTLLGLTALVYVGVVYYIVKKAKK